MRHLGVFAKYWDAGAVKTRLGQQIGMQKAADFYLAMFETTVQRFADCGDTRTIAFTPPDRGAEIRKLAGSRWQFELQTDGDLGQRMSTFAAAHLLNDNDRVLILGTDSPHVPLGWIEDAFAELEHHDVVLGPSTDGGYYMIGMRGRVPPIFEDMRWSTSEVFSTTVGRLAASDHSLVVLNETFDVDHMQGVKLLSEFLETVSDAAFAQLRSAVAEVKM